MKNAVLLSLLVGAVIVSAAEQASQPSPPAPATPGQPVAPPRAGGRPATPEKGTAIIRGRVTAAGTDEPLRRVFVRAFMPDVRDNHAAETDGEGRFEITELPAGRYRVTAEKSGFVAVEFGQRRPGSGSGTPLDLADGQLAERVNLTLVRGAAISGRLMDDAGDPIAGAEVVAVRYMFQSGRRRLAPQGSAQTDDEGAFRVFGLPAGEYFVRAMRNQPRLMGTGQRRRLDPFTPTFYPGTPAVASAQRIVVKAGQLAPNLSFALATAKTVLVSGRVLGSNGLPLTGAVITMGPKDVSDGLQFLTHGDGLRPDGTFQFASVAPGQYTIRVMPIPQGRPDGELRGEHARLDVTVSGTNLEDVLIVSGPAGIVRGRIITDDGSPLPEKPDGMLLMARLRDPEQENTFQFHRVTLNDDWTFEIRNVLDSMLIGYAGAAQDWSLLRVQHDGIDLTDRGVSAPSGSVVENVEAVLTRKVTEVSGRVTDDRGRAASDATLVIFASNRERWTPGSRYVRTVRPDTSGRYQISLAPDADYLIVAVRDLEDGQHNDPEFLDGLVAVALRFSIGAGERKAVDVKVVEQP